MEVKFNINDELNELNRNLNNAQVPLFDNYEMPCYNTEPSAEDKYLLYVLELTYKHPQIETYLKQLLENFSIVKLNNFNTSNYTILHHMMHVQSNISLNSFEIIINLGINVNYQTETGDTPLHIICYEPSEHELNIISLFVKYGADLNILNDENLTVLDGFLWSMKSESDEVAKKNTIKLLIDLGAKTNNPDEEVETELLEFIESYCSSNTAIKNEI